MTPLTACLEKLFRDLGLGPDDVQLALTIMQDVIKAHQLSVVNHVASGHEVPLAYDQDDVVDRALGLVDVHFPPSYLVIVREIVDRISV
jgi:hypothetical protein